MTREERLDRWLEALMGARLRFHCIDEPKAHFGYWGRVYKRWSQLYHQQHPI